MEELLLTISENPLGCDLILCLFVAALNSYRSDRCLRPFPALYTNKDGKNVTALRQVCEAIPILGALEESSNEVIELLKWLLIEKTYPILKRIHLNDVTFPSQIPKVFEPNYIFEVCYHENYEKLWQNRIGARDTFLAYHGSPIDNFYSILKVGLQQHFSLEKELLFGNGIYLSNEVSLSAHYSPFGQSWKNSALGNKLSIIALCEVINDVNKVKYKDSTNKMRSMNDRSDIPEKYFVVTDSDMVRVKYLMVYSKRVFSVKSYLSNNLFITMLVIYFVIIVAIGFFNNSMHVKLLRRFISSLL